MRLSLCRLDKNGSPLTHAVNDNSLQYVQYVVPTYDVVDTDQILKQSYYVCCVGPHNGAR